MKIIVGDSSRFSIDSSITEYLKGSAQRGVGYFTVKISGKRFGVMKPDATLLACSFDAVKNRIERRGNHIFPFVPELEPSKIVSAYLASCYRGFEKNDRFFGISGEEFQKLIHNNSIAWCPDGDEAFDDGSHILQMDHKNLVRLLAFKNIGTMKSVFDTIVDLWLDGDEFYGVLSEWHNRFAQAWSAEL